MAADVGRDMMGPKFLLDQLHGREDRPLGAAGTEAGRARRHLFSKLPNLVLTEEAAMRPEMVDDCRGGQRRSFFQEAGDAVPEDRGGVFTRHRAACPCHAAAFQVLRGATWC